MLPFKLANATSSRTPNERLEDDACPDDDEQDSQDRQVKTKQVPYIHNQGEAAQDDGALTHLDSLDVAGSVETQHDQPHADRPGCSRASSRRSGRGCPG